MRRGRRPSEREELLLRTALSPPSDAAAMSRALDPLDSCSPDLLPLAYRTLVAAGVEDESLGRLKGVYRRTWYGNQLLLRRASEALEVLRAQGVDAMVLGGAAVALLHYRDVGARSMSDTTIAVRPLPSGRALLRDAGWHPLPVSGADDDVWDARVPLEVGDVSTYAPCPGDQLLRACARGVTWSPSCRWVADALVILDSSRDAIDWERLVRQATEKRVVPHLHMAFSYLRGTFSAPVPASVVRSLRAAAPPLGSVRVQLARARAFRRRRMWSLSARNVPRRSASRSLLRFPL